MSRGREFLLVAAVSAMLTVALTWPLARHLGSVGRIDNSDGQFSIWNVAWVARTLVVDPLHVFDANIFYPHRTTLAYSENNLGAGALAIPFWWATRNAYFAHNAVVLLAFMLSWLGTYYLTRYLAGDWRAAAVSATAFAFCPYIFARTAHIQLLMTAGLPFTMLAFHRMTDRPSVGRGTALGLVMAAQAACCGYYGVFVILMVGFGVVVVSLTRGLWRVPSFWIALAAGAAVSLALVVPLFLPYAALQRVEGFGRPLDEAVRWSADWRAYFASSGWGHTWMLPLLGHWSEVVFPGFTAVLFAAVGAIVARGRRDREAVVLYGGLAVLACWASFGPAAGLYRVLYRVLPVFAWLRAPGRFGLIVAFGLSVVAAFGVRALVQRTGHGSLVAAIVLLAAAAELRVPLDYPAAERLDPVYRVLATLPRGPVIEMPFYYPAVGLFQHTKYMLNSTSHWMPLVNGYSDYIPPDFMEHVLLLSSFPSRDAFRILEPSGVRYAVFHLYGYNDENRRAALARLDEFAPYLRPVYSDGQTRLYEIVVYPK